MLAKRSNGEKGAYEATMGITFSPLARHRLEEKWSFKKVVSTFASLPRVVRLVWSTSRGLTLLLGLLNLAQGFLPVLSLSITALVIDGVVQAMHTRSVLPLWGPVGLQLGITLCSSVLGSLTVIVQQLLQERVSNRVQLEVLKKASTLDLAFFENPESYDKIRQVTNQTAYQPTSLIAQTFGMAQTVVTLASLLLLLFHLSWWLAGIALLAPLPAFFFSTHYGWRGYQLVRQQSPERRLMTYVTMLLTTDTYAKEIKLFNLGPFFTSRFWKLAVKLYQQDKKLAFQRAFTTLGWSSLTSIVNSGIYLYVALQTIAGRLTLGSLILYTQTATQVGQNVQSILNSLSTTYENTLYVNLLFEFLAYQSRILSPPVAQQCPSNPHADGYSSAMKNRQWPRNTPMRVIQEHVDEGGSHEQTPGLEIEFRNVSFTYPGKHPQTEAAIMQVSFTIRAGETIALVGSNGAGKTTLVKLLTRLYEPDEGDILIGGRNIKEYNLEVLRQHIGVIFQDFANYYLTARENIGVGRIEVIDNRSLVMKAAHKSGAHAVIERLPQGYDTTLGRWFKSLQESTQLSGGEWQKIALARAFMREAAILVLDEPTSALDAQAEYEIFQQFRTLSTQKTALFISHRFSTVRLADRIFVLEHGKIIESGSHEDLMALGGRYAELFNLQAEAYRST